MSWQVILPPVHRVLLDHLVWRGFPEFTGKEKQRMSGSCRGEYTGEGHFILEKVSEVARRCKAYPLVSPHAYRCLPYLSSAGLRAFIRSAVALHQSNPQAFGLPAAACPCRDIVSWWQSALRVGRASPAESSCRTPDSTF